MLALIPPRAEGGPAPASGADDAEVLGAGGMATVCVEGAELALKRSARTPLGPDSSEGEAETGMLALMPPRAEGGPAPPGGADDAEVLGAGGMAAELAGEEDEENTEHPASAGSAIKTT